MPSKLFTIKSLSPTNDWYAVLDKKGTAEFCRVVAWAVLDGEDKDDEIGAAINAGEEGIVIVGDFYSELAGYTHVNDLDGAAKRFKLNQPPGPLSAAAKAGA